MRSSVPTWRRCSESPLAIGIRPLAPGAAQERGARNVQLGEANSRSKDYYDLVMLARTLAFDGSLLVESIRRTFERRATAIPPGPLDGLSDAFAEHPLNTGRWRAFLEKSGLRAGSPDLREVVMQIRRFTEPPLEAAQTGRPLVEHWPPGGPWR